MTDSPQTDFWPDSGYDLLQVRDDGRLAVTDAYLRRFLQRPELAPVAESNAAERQLHAELLDRPRMAVPDSRLDALGDPDAVENYQVALAFRDRLVQSGTLEAAYLGLFLNPGAHGGVPVPPLFVDLLAQAIVRHLIAGTQDALRARAAELLFREQAVTINEGFIMTADHAVVERHAEGGGFGDLGRLVQQAQTPLRTVDLDVLDSETAHTYWARAHKHDTVLNLNFAGDGLDAFCRVLEAWVAHMLGVRVAIQPVQQITDARWVWHVGLDKEASRLLDDLWHGAEVGDARLARLLSLFRLEFQDPSVMIADIQGRPVYLALMMTEDKRLKLKPQNLLLNLPLAERA
ncbi:DUF6352 family protein [Rhodovibrio salinarum]|uniref:Uncharacterized protein n=1 Tax=Rhodovibrio salinarum TaxID=1087 RepID=A0A934UYY5_9PROT|nr:DUF6352 family protein [Rhodovibrio salinarum]MBK1695954.1 hypothetical protein [Rhodovibrio salinarum]